MKLSCIRVSRNRIEWKKKIKNIWRKDLFQAKIYKQKMCWPTNRTQTNRWMWFRSQCTAIYAFTSMHSPLDWTRSLVGLTIDPVLSLKIHSKNFFRNERSFCQYLFCVLFWCFVFFCFLHLTTFWLTRVFSPLSFAPRINIDCSNTAKAQSCCKMCICVCVYDTRPSLFLSMHINISKNQIKSKHFTL